MADDLTLRTCGRAGCRWPAAASLSFRYGTGEVWLLDLSSEPDPALYDLCPHHADSLTVPRGWERVDQRSSPAAVAEPAGRDLDPRGGGAPPGAGGYGGNRYAALTAALPRLAREYRAGAGHDPGGHDGHGAQDGHEGIDLDLDGHDGHERHDHLDLDGDERAVVVPIEGKARRRG